MPGSKPYARDCKPGLPGCKMLIGDMYSYATISFMTSKFVGTAVIWHRETARESSTRKEYGGTSENEENVCL